MTARASNPDLLVAGVGLWLPGVPDVAAWRAGDRGVASPDDGFTAASGASIERRARRRASPLCRAIADAYTAAAEQADIDTTANAAVFGSALGEVQTMLSLLDQISRGEELSPMGFATSVHSAASGTMSISAGNRGFTTSISAYHDTPAAAVFEARGLVQTRHTPVVLACGDTYSPARFVEGEEAFGMVAAAVAVVPEAADAQVLARLQGPHRGEATVAPADVPPLLGRNPECGLLDLVVAIVEGRTGVVSLDRGRGSGWCVTVASP
jgi:hypothetical protein